MARLTPSRARRLTTALPMRRVPATIAPRPFNSSTLGRASYARPYRSEAFASRQSASSATRRWCARSSLMRSRDESRSLMTLRSATVLLLAALSCVCAAFAGWREAEREPPFTLALPAGGDLQKAVDGIATNEPSATICLGEGEFPLERFVSIDRDGVNLRRP